ncbi:unnamed protein product [Bursaphelenchus xylophilus]|uniref:(pine wood nematode) hypothetical protein n=1 Tax=Bursaphelenchus xylophilus TaxID=6326 RepID=A0A1I7S264_BURXY|nr:unnamed protein product [Bursaphelenchus xylophilus]CAG9114868.1 unnamed protein product [Bursaphelenchus xylophilus]
MEQVILGREKPKNGKGNVGMDLPIVHTEGMRPILNWVDKISDDEENGEPNGDDLFRDSQTVREQTF